MRSATHPLLVFALLTGSGSAIAFADGGQVRVMERHGNCQLTVFTSPNPLRAGPVDVSVLVHDAKTGQPLPAATVTVKLTSSDPSQPPLRVAATTAAATNKLLRAALVELPTPGRWQVFIACAPAGDQATVETKFTMEAAPSLPRWLAVWPWFTWPIAAVLLFAIHCRLVARRQTRRALRELRNNGEPIPLLSLTHLPT